MGKLNLVAEPGKQEIVMTRDFNAPRALIFKTYIDPTLVPQWWGPREYTTIVDEMEVRMGGIWRYIQRGADGGEFAFRGVFHEITAPERLVFTFEFEGMPGHILLETVTLQENHGKTTVTDTLVFQSVADRDAMLQSGMERGASDTWERFDELLVTLK